MGRPVRALTRALDILELFLDERRPLSAPEITASLGLPRTTVHELVGTLVERSYLEPTRDGEHRYTLGVRLLQLGSIYEEEVDLVRLGHQAAADIAAACGETVHVAVLDATDAVYIAKTESTHAVRMVSAVGRRLPAHCTAVGKMLLAGLDTAEIDARFPPNQPLPTMTKNSISSRAALKRQLADIRARGLAYDNCESNPDVMCVAAPVLDHTDRTVAAISISLPTTRWAPEKRTVCEELVVSGADSLSIRLGRPPRVRDQTAVL
jgi:IclR family transcriptional regulator, KDG regulon repressor